MKTHIPDYFDQFRCLAGDCPDTCCAGWEIVVDDASADRFRAMEDAMGKRLQQSLITVDGETTAYKTDAEGKVLLSFDRKGTYVVSATSDSLTLTPPVCVVTVK